MLGTVGDLVEDIVVHLGEPINVASDTEALITRRRGGSAANMAVAVVRAGGSARFIGQVGADPAGEQLTRVLADDGVDVVVRRGGRTGSIVVVLDHRGERTFLTDRAACALLDDPDPAWLDGLAALHVPAYSLIGDPLATTAATLIRWAHERGVLVSIDASSASVIERVGASAMCALLTSLTPDVLLCNELEAEALGGVDAEASIGAGVTIVKHGGAAALVLARGAPAVEVPAEPVEDVRDTTGAGDAFAAGFLLALTAGDDPVAATRRGHTTAAAAIRRVSAEQPG